MGMWRRIHSWIDKRVDTLNNELRAAKSDKQIAANILLRKNSSRKQRNERQELHEHISISVKLELPAKWRVVGCFYAL
jgi:hypothetical protein